jgi:hypothetical protein
MLFKPINMKTFLTKISFMVLTKPLTIFIPLRFSSKGPGPIKEGSKLLGKGSTPKPLPPSPLKTPGSIVDKSKNYPKPIAPKYYYNHNTYVVGHKPVLDNPYVAFALTEKQKEHDALIKTQQGNAMILDHIKKSSSYSTSAQTSSGTSTHSSSHQNTTTTTTSHADPKGIVFCDKPPIPTPPTLPLKPLVKAQPAVPITENALQNAAKTLKPPKPLIPENTLIPDVSNEKPETVSKIALESAKKLSREDLVKEMLSRGLFTKDNTIPIEVITDAGEKVIIGKGTDYKLTGIGYAYVKKISKPLYIKNTDDVKEETFDFYIGVAKHKENLFLNSGDQTHMFVVYKRNDKTWFSPGYLTSKPTDVHLGDMQFKLYQDINYGGNIPNNKLKNKPQFFTYYDNAKNISKDQIILLKGGHDYIEYLGKTAIMTTLCQKIMKKDYVNYNPEGITIEQCIAACMDYDTVVKKKLSHPPIYADILNSAQMAAKEAIKKKAIKPLTDETIPE